MTSAPVPTVRDELVAEFARECEALAAGDREARERIDTILDLWLELR